MRGSEKQIAWAKELLAVMDEKLCWIVENCPEEMRQQWQLLKEKYDRILEDSYAGDVIFLLKNNHKEHPLEYYRNLYTDVSICGEETAMRIKKEVYGKEKKKGY